MLEVALSGQPAFVSGCLHLRTCKAHGFASFLNPEERFVRRVYCQRSSRAQRCAKIFLAMDLQRKLEILDAMMSPKSGPIDFKFLNLIGGKNQSARGDVIVEWLLKAGFASDESDACTVATELVRCSGLMPLQRVDSAAMAFLPSRERQYVHYGMSVVSTAGLNAHLGGGYPANSRMCFAILKDMSYLLKELIDSVVVRRGHEVQYGKIRRSEAWNKMLVLASELQDCTIEDNVPDDVKKACLFNLYNIMIIHGKLAFGHPQDLAARGKFFNAVCYVIANHRLTSTELEHDVLRRRMANDHPLAALKLSEKDPRMHFILNCGAQSCPPLVAVEPERTEQILNDATRRFIQQNCETDEVKRRVTLSRLWKWFRNDFTPGTTDNGALLRWIAKRAPDGVAKSLDFLLADMRAKSAKITFLKYNWADNGDWNAKPDVAFMALYDFNFKKTA